LNAWSKSLLPKEVNFRDSLGRKAVVPVIERFPSVSMCWIDALCINQHDDADKQMQIPLTEQIIESAVAVIVLLTCELDLH